jgi:Spy/CpxP family protein refolding chaperone
MTDGVSAQSGAAAQTSGQSSGSGRQSGDGRGGSDRGNNSTPGLPPTWEWWSDADIKRTIGLTEQQVKKIDDIYQDRRRRDMAYALEFARSWAELDRVTVERSVDEGTYGVMVQAVEALGSRLRESRTTMLYRIYRQLQPDQYTKLRGIIDRRTKDGRGRGAGPGPR